MKDLKQRKKNHNFRKINNKYYYQELRKLKSKNIFLFPITDFNFQNYLDFPVLFKKKEKILKYLIKKGYDLKGSIILIAAMNLEVSLNLLIQKE